MTISILRGLCYFAIRYLSFIRLYIFVYFLVLEKNVFQCFASEILMLMNFSKIQFVVLRTKLFLNILKYTEIFQCIKKHIYI